MCTADMYSELKRLDPSDAFEHDNGQVITFFTAPPPGNYRFFVTHDVPETGDTLQHLTVHRDSRAHKVFLSAIRLLELQC